MRYKPSPSDQIKKHWFPVAILACIIFASIFPQFGTKNGPLRPEITVKYGCISLIFLLSSLSLKTDHILQTIKQYKLHLFVQGFTFCVVPVLVQILVTLLGHAGLLDGWIRQGLITVACMPPPVSSAVVLTRVAGGNESAAIFNSVLGSFLGIFVTPLLLLINLGSTTLIPFASTILQLSITVLLPLIFGQMIRRCPQVYHNIKNLPLNTLGQVALLLIIFTTFCETFDSRDFHLSALDILLTVLLVLLLQMLLLALSFSLAKSLDWEFSPRDVVAIVFCTTHKSLTLGIPILRVIFHGFSHLGQISLPLLVYHPTQIILGGFLVAGLKDWVHQHKTNKRLPL